MKHEDLSGGNTLHLTERQIKKIKRAASDKKGVDLKLSKSQIQRTLRFIKASVGKGLHVGSKGGTGLYINPPNVMRRPPPFIGSWDKKKMNFEDRPLTDFDLRQWCKQLKIPLKGIYSRDEARPPNHSPCIINLDDFGGLGTHWVCCRHAGEYEYFDSFGLPPPLEWENDLTLAGNKTFLRNDNQLQWEGSRSFKDILNLFSDNLKANEAVVKQYFLG